LELKREAQIVIKWWKREDKPCKNSLKNISVLYVQVTLSGPKRNKNEVSPRNTIQKLDRQSPNTVCERQPVNLRFTKTYFFSSDAASFTVLGDTTYSNQSALFFKKKCALPCVSYHITSHHIKSRQTNKMEIDKLRVHSRQSSVTKNTKRLVHVRIRSNMATQKGAIISFLERSNTE